MKMDACSDKFFKISQLFTRKQIRRDLIRRPRFAASFNSYLGKWQTMTKWDLPKFKTINFQLTTLLCFKYQAVKIQNFLTVPILQK